MKKILRSLPRRIPHRIGMPLVAAVIFLLHVSYLPNGFMWLDHGDLEGGRSIVHTAHDLFFKRFGDTNFYRPLVSLVNTIDFSLYGLHPFGYHLTNLLLFTAIPWVSVIFFSCFFKLSRQEKTVIALIIGVHPLGWLPLGVISYRPELLYVLTTELFVISHVKARTLGERKWWSVPPILLLFSFFSKETALFTAPVIIFVWELLRKTKLRNGRIVFGGELGAVFVYIILRVIAVPGWWSKSAHIMTVSEQIGTRVNAAGRLMWMIIDPRLPHFSDAINVTPIRQELIVFGFFAVILSFILLKQANNAVRISMTLFAVVFLPALNILHLPRFVSPHYAFFPMILFVALLVTSVRGLHSGVKYGAIITVALWIVVTGAISFQGGARFKDDYALFHPEVVYDARFLEGHFYLGDYFYQKGKLSAADREYTAAYAPRSRVIAFVDRSAAVVSLANVKRLEKEYSEAERLLKKVMSVNPAVHDVALYDLAVIAYEKKEYDKVISLLNSGNPEFRNKPTIMRLLQTAIQAAHEQNSAGK